MSLVSGNNAIDALVYSSWKSSPGSPITLTYAFFGDALPADMSEDNHGYKPLSGRQKQAVRDALATWSAVADITFVELPVGQRANIEFGTNTQRVDNTAAYAYLPDGSGSVSLFLNNEVTSSVRQEPGTYGFAVLVHEIGHTLGLKHPGDYNAGGSTMGGAVLPFELDNRDFTQMSYTKSTSFAYTLKEPVTPMLYDIQAVQFLYGVNKTYNASDNVYQFDAATIPLCVWDAGGNDTFDFSACTSAAVIDLRAGQFSSTKPKANNISIAYNAVIEHAIGSAFNDLIYGNSASSSINGGAGTDTVVLAGTRRDYAVARDDGAVKMAHSGGSVDTLVSVERIRFDDGAVALDIDGVAGQMYRLYQAAFNRTPDLEGLGFWIGMGDQGTALEAVSNAFVNSKEFLDTYGSLSDAQFITQLYQNVLHREPDQAGLDFHVNFLVAQTTTRATALMAFSESAENQAALIGVISDGISYIGA